MHTPTCPEHPLVALSPKKKGWHCQACDDVVLTYDEHPRGTDPTQHAATALRSPNVSLAATMPTLLALPLEEAAHEASPVPALWALCDLAETTLKFVVMAGVAEHVAGTGRLPDALDAELRDRVELPTMGKWLGMALAVARHAPAESPLPLAPLAGTLDTLLGTREATPDAGLLALRNRLAHAGPVTRAEAERLLARWRPRVLDWAARALAPLAAVALVAVDAAGARYLLRGPTGSTLVRDDAEDGGVSALLPVDAPAGSVWLCAGPSVLCLGPLGAFDLDQRGLQVYVRSGELRLQYLRLGEEGGLCDSDAAARDLFQRTFLSRRSAASDGPARFSVRDFDTELRREASRRVGRERELATLGAAVRAMGTGALWLGGPAGIGKSNLVAALMEDLAAHPPMGAIVLPYRFRAGDDRCGRSPFLTYLRERLEASGALLEDAHHERPDDTAPGAEGGSPPSATPPPRPPQTDPVQEVRDLVARLRPERRLFLVLDGLDEVVERDPRFVDDVLFRLRADRVAIVAAGRPERGLPQGFARIGATEPFPEGLPAMIEADVRALLLERTGPVRKRLLARDREAEGALRNGFVEVVTRRSDGLPIYVNHVIGDLNAGRLSPESTDALPASLHAYHDELLRRAAVGDLQAVTTPTLVLLSLAFEPLSAEELAALLVRCGRLDGPSTELVERAVHAIGSMVRKAPDPDGNEGYTLFHHSLRTHVLQGAHLRETVGALRRALADTAGRPAGDAAEVYLYRCGVQHLLDADRPAEALGILTDFERLMARFQRLEATGRAADDWYADWDRVRLRVGALEGAARHWWDLARTTRHLYRKAGWEPWRVLFQSAMDHADDSAVTHAAEAYEVSGRRDWAWLRWLDRPKEWREDPCVAVMVGHADHITGAIELSGGRVLTWSNDATLRTWDVHTGSPITTFTGHTHWVNGAVPLDDDRALSWSEDGTLRTWDANTGMPIAILTNSTMPVRGALVLEGQRIFAWREDGSSCFWDARSGEAIAKVEGHVRSVRGATLIDATRIVSWSDANTLYVLDAQTGIPVVALKGHRKTVRGTIALDSRRIASWSFDHTVRIWSIATGRTLAVLEGHEDFINGTVTVGDSSIVSWSDDGTLRVWHSIIGFHIDVLRGHTTAVTGALALDDERVLSWSDGDTLRIWNVHTGESIPVLERAVNGNDGGIVLSNGWIALWCLDYTLRVLTLPATAPIGTTVDRPIAQWSLRARPGLDIVSYHSDGTLTLSDASTGVITQLAGCTAPLRGAQSLPHRRLLTWTNDHVLHLWDACTGAAIATLKGHTYTIKGVLALANDRILSWSDDCTLRVWDTTTGACEHILAGHTHWVSGVLLLRHGRVLSWSWDGTLRIWDVDSGATASILEGHTNVVSGAFELADGRIVSWSRSARLGSSDTNSLALRIWNANTGATRAVLQGHKTSIDGAVSIGGDRILSWCRDGTLRLWDVDGGACIAILAGHTDCIAGTQILQSGRILSWSDDRTLRIWDERSGAPIAVLEGHARRVSGTLELAERRILSWSEDQSGDATLRLWDADTGAVLAVYAAPRDWQHAPEDVVAARPQFRDRHHSLDGTTHARQFVPPRPRT